MENQLRDVLNAGKDVSVKIEVGILQVVGCDRITFSWQQLLMEKLKSSHLNSDWNKYEKYRGCLCMHR